MKVMDYQKNIMEMVQKITDESVLKIIYDFVMVPYNRERGENQNELQKNDC